YEDRLAFFVNAASQVPAEIGLDDLRRERLAGAFNQSGWQAIWQDIAAASHGLDAVRKLDLGAVEAVKRQVETRGGIGVLFELALRSDFASGRFRQVMVRELSYSHAFHLVLRHSAPPLARAFVAFLRDRVH
ncbi:MAG: LysR substrate-binding domain-containing protein, partial [Chloroflexota bacterium]